MPNLDGALARGITLQDGVTIAAGIGDVDLAVAGCTDPKRSDGLWTVDNWCLETGAGRDIAVPGGGSQGAGVLMVGAGA